MLRAKCTSSSVAGDSLTVRFRLPNGHRLEHEFTTECYVEVGSINNCVKVHNLIKFFIFYGKNVNKSACKMYNL